MKAFLKNYRQSPQKVRLVAKSIVGKSVEDAVLILSFMPKRAALPLQKLILSAKANAGQAGTTEDLKVEKLEVNKGITLKRIRARARGSAYRINKRTSNVTVLLSTPKEEDSSEDKKKDKKDGAAPAKKVATKKKATKKAPAKKKATKKVAKKKVAKKADK